MVGRIARALVASTVGVALLPGVTAAAAPGPRELTATPSTDLVDGQVITARASGLRPAWPIAVLQCDAAATDVFGCAIDAALFHRTTEQGRLTVQFGVSRAIDTPRLGFQDCASAPGACMLAVADLEHVQLVVTTPLSFDPNGPPPEHPRRVTVQLAPDARVDRDGVAYVTGTANCNRTSLLLLFVNLIQTAGAGETSGMGIGDVSHCNGTVEWEVPVGSERGFVPGHAVATVDAVVFDHPHGGESDTVATDIGRITLTG